MTDLLKKFTTLESESGQGQCCSSHKAKGLEWDVPLDELDFWFNDTRPPASEPLSSPQTRTLLAEMEIRMEDLLRLDRLPPFNPLRFAHS